MYIILYFVFCLVHECVKIITRSKKPVMVIGSQALSGVPAGERAELLKQVVEDIGIPCYLGGMARGLLGRYSKLLMRHARKEALKEADCIILAGTLHFLFISKKLKKVGLEFIIYVWFFGQEPSVISG